MCIKSTLKESDTFCLMPWIHLHVSTRGLCQACCIAPITFGNINKESIQEIWEGEKINHFRANLLKGIKDKRCNGCYTLEESGARSIRQETLEKYDHLLESVLAHKARLPVYLDIRFSNVCNFRCITCWHGASSKWFEEAKAKNNHVAETAIIKALDNENEFFRQFEELISGAQEFYFAGGEPLVMEEHYRVLDLLLEYDKTNVHLRYNTNLSLLQFKEKSILDYWKKFEKVTVSASIDAAGELGEKIRRDSNWKVIKENLRQIKTECHHVKLEIAPTISSLNILVLPELHRELVKEGLIDIDAIYINILQRPLQYHVKNVENKNKGINAIKDYIDWLDDCNASDKTIHRIRELFNVLGESQ